MFEIRYSLGRHNTTHIAVPSYEYLIATCLAEYPASPVLTRAIILAMTHSHLQQGQAELPSASSTKSYWHRQPSPTLTGHRTTEQLPSSADVIVIGSGITGAFVARELVSGGQQVVMLEAREACWGATGRVRAPLSSTLFMLF